MDGLLSRLCSICKSQMRDRTEKKDSWNNVIKQIQNSQIQGRAARDAENCVKCGKKIRYY